MTNESLQGIKNEWPKVRKAPWSFAVLSLAVGGAVFAIVTWYYAGRIDTLQTQVKSLTDAVALKDQEIARLRVVAGLAEASKGILVSLSNVELKAKTANLVAKLREFEGDFSRSFDAAIKGGIPEQPHLVLRSYHQRFQRDLRPDAANLDVELRRRLDPRALAAAIPNISPAPIDGVLFSIESLATMTKESAAFAGMLAATLDQMQRMLPEK